MIPELQRLETEIFYDRKLRRIDAIREAFAAYMKTIAPKEPWWKFWSKEEKSRPFWV